MAMHVSVGELNKRIQILHRSSTSDGEGYLTELEPAPDPEVVHKCWAKFSQTSGSELMKAGADFGQERVRFLIRYTAKPIHRKMRVRYGGTDYEIEYINDYGDSHRYIELWCRWDGTGGRP